MGSDSGIQVFSIELQGWVYEIGGFRAVHTGLVVWWKDNATNYGTWIEVNDVLRMRVNIDKVTFAPGQLEPLLANPSAYTPSRNCFVADATKAVRAI